MSFLNEVLKITSFHKFFNKLLFLIKILYFRFIMLRKKIFHFKDIFQFWGLLQIFFSHDVFVIPLHYIYHTMEKNFSHIIIINFFIKILLIELFESRKWRHRESIINMIQIFFSTYFRVISLKLLQIFHHWFEHFTW